MQHQEILLNLSKNQNKCKEKNKKPNIYATKILYIAFKNDGFKVRRKKPSEL